MAYEMDGTIKIINDTQTFSKGFTKREFVLTTDDRYPQEIKFELVKEKTTLLDSYKAGDRVRVAFDVRGSEYNGRHFVNLVAWKLQEAGAAPEADGPEPARTAPARRQPQAAGASSNQPVKNQPQGPDDVVEEFGDDDGIPF